MNEQNDSAWNFEKLTEEDESNSNDDFFSTLRKRVAQNVYHDIGSNDDKEDLSKQKSPIKQDRLSTTRIDGSDLISRCRNFLPLLTDANRTLQSKIDAGEDVRFEADSEDSETSDDEKKKRIIEMNLLFCPDESSSSDESDDQTSDNESKQSETNLNILIDTEKKSSLVNIVELSSEQFSEEKPE